MAYELFKNNATTTTSGSVNNSSDPVTVAVTSAVLFPASGNFRILIDSEILLVTAVSGSNFTCTRAIEGTSIASHSSGATVTQLLTNGGLDQTILDRWNSGTANNHLANYERSYQATDVPAFVHNRGYMQYAPPMALYTFTANSWTWFSQSTSTISQTGPFSALLTTPHSASDQIRGLYTSYTPGQTVDCWINPGAYVGANGSYLMPGIGLGASGSGKLFLFHPRFHISAGFPIFELIRHYWSNNTTISSSSTLQYIAPQWPCMLRISDNGSGTATLKFSNDGITFFTHDTYNYSGDFTSNFACIGMYNSTGAAQSVWYHNFRIY